MRQGITDNFDQIAAELKAGNLVVMKSDTIYGIFAAALNEKAIEKLYRVRQREPNRGSVILVDSIATIEKIVDLSPEIKSRMKNYWPDAQTIQNLSSEQIRAKFPATSVILADRERRFPWLNDTRGAESELSFRIPNDLNLRKLLSKTGPLSAPSANLPDQPPARNIVEARAYFAKKVSLYIDGGECAENAPSRIIRFRADNSVETLRSDGREHPEDFVIARRRKQFRFANFDAYENCFRLDEWQKFRAEHPELNNCHPRTRSEDPVDSRNKRENDNDNEIVMEIGAGSGEFLTELARRNPDKTYLAIDRKSDRLYRGARKALESQINNVFFIYVSADRLKSVMPANSVSEIWVTFPDPFAREIYQSKRAELAKFHYDFLRFPDDEDYAKNKEIYEKDLRNFDIDSAKNFDKYLSSDSRKRLTAPRFLNLYKEILKPDGRLLFKTDNSPLFEWSMLSFQKNNWKVKFIARDLHADPNAPLEAKVMTSYEQRFSAEGLPIKYAEFSLS